MKKTILTIIAFIMLSLNGFCIPKDARLIADETWIAQTKTTVKIITSNQTIKERLMRSNFKNFTQTIKKDRKGDYMEYTFSYSIQTFKMPNL